MMGKFSVSFRHKLGSKSRKSRSLDIPSEFNHDADSLDKYREKDVLKRRTSFTPGCTSVSLFITIKMIFLQHFCNSLLLSPVCSLDNFDIILILMSMKMWLFHAEIAQHAINLCSYVSVSTDEGFSKQ